MERIEGEKYVRAKKGTLGHINLNDTGFEMEKADAPQN